MLCRTGASPPTPDWGTLPCRDQWRGKGVKILNLSSKGEPESLTALTVVTPGNHLLVHSGKRYLNLKPSDWREFLGNRALRGNKLPRGYQNVALLETAEK